MISACHKNYRPDFILQISKPAPPNYKPTPESIKARTFHFIIEADGHDFHEKTKEQAKRDKIRDRHLIQEGYTILHFTGSEIWNDSDGVMKEIINQISARLS
jgi:hypothetical protein